MKGKSARRWLAETVIAVAIVLLGTAGGGRTADPDALWKVVHDKCVPEPRAEWRPGTLRARRFTGGRREGLRGP
jgi:CDP-diacylglycerol pyrophosphatase